MAMGWFCQNNENSPHGGSIWEAEKGRKEEAKNAGKGPEDPGASSGSTTDSVTSAKSLFLSGVLSPHLSKDGPTLTSEDPKGYSRTHSYLLTSLWHSSSRQWMVCSNFSWVVSWIRTKKHNGIIRRQAHAQISPFITLLLKSFAYANLY